MLLVATAGGLLWYMPGWHPSDRAYPLQGIDVSHHQGAIDRAARPAQGGLDLDRRRPAFPIRMTRLPFLAATLIAAGCATAPTVYQPVADPIYTAIGRDPFWMVAIGDSRIVLRLPREDGDETGEVNDIIYPRVLPRTVGSVRTWQSGEGTQVITIEARPGPCDAGRQLFADRVRVRLSGRELNGCGGRPLREEAA